MGTIQEAVAERVAGDRPSRLKSALVATTVGFMAAALAYRLLRSGAVEGEESADEST
jgi:hypothetical protein